MLSAEGGGVGGSLKGEKGVRAGGGVCGIQKFCPSGSWALPFGVCFFHFFVEDASRNSSSERDLFRFYSHVRRLARMCCVAPRHLLHHFPLVCMSLTWKTRTGYVRWVFACFRPIFLRKIRKITPFLFANKPVPEFALHVSTTRE